MRALDWWGGGDGVRVTRGMQAGKRGRITTHVDHRVVAEALLDGGGGGWTKWLDGRGHDRTMPVGDGFDIVNAPLGQLLACAFVLDLAAKVDVGVPG